MRKKFSLKWKILLIFFSISVIMLTSILIVSILLNTKNVKELAKTNMNEIANQTIDSLQLYFNEKMLQLKAISNDPNVINYVLTGENEKTVLNILETQFNQYGQFENYFITDKNGITILDGAGGMSIDLDIKGFPFWRLSKEKLDFHLDDIIYESPNTAKLVTVAAVRVEDNEGNFIGLIGMPIYWEKFIEEYITSKKLGNTGYIFMLDKGMKVIAHNDKELILNDFSKYDFTKKMYESDGGFYRYYFDVQKKWKYMSFTTFNKTGWKVAVTIEEDEFLAAINKARNIMLGLGILIFLIGSIVIFIFTNGISIVIKMVAEGARRFAVGDIILKGMDWNKMEKINKRTDELGDIGNAFSSLIEYLKEKVDISKEIAKGNLMVETTISSDADQLGIAMTNTVKSLNTILSQVNASVEQVNTGSIQVSAASQQLSQGASEQASSLEEITSSITEINSQAKQNAESATTANKFATNAKDNAQDGNKLMKELVEAMTKINSSSDEIKKIVKVIDDIAFQTNLLALNANVEAARAGKYGKGFAVVAEEVRNLASRSAEAVKETTAMVEDSIKNIVNSNTLVEKTATQLEEIVKGAEEVVKLVEEIALASKEQAQGLDQINIGLGQIDQVTQENTASAEESASAAEELASQAELLKGMVARFKLKQIEDTMNQQKLIHETNKELIQEEIKKREEKRKKNIKLKPLKHIEEHLKDNEGSDDNTDTIALDKESKDIDMKNMQSIDDDDFGKF